MKSLLLPALLLLTILQGFAQSVAVNTTGNIAHPSAILDLTSNDKGILIPRMTTAEREAIQNPATGLMVYDTDARNFWFFAPGWQEIVTHQDMGDASGDLTGTFPAPLVAKIQGHPVSGLTPQDNQVLKWDASEYIWKGKNDSLSLPFVATAPDPNALFSVTNSFNGFSMNNLAILGRRITGSGIEFNFPTAIWGDAYVGTGLLGTSYIHEGVYGKSEQNHGVYGTSNGGWTKAGLFGFGTGGAAGVRGEIEDGSIGVHGKATGADASAGKFENIYPTNDYPALIASTNGLGSVLEVNSTNSTSTSPAVVVSMVGSGKALEIHASHPSTTEPAVEVTSLGNGHGLTIAHSGGGNTIGLNAIHAGNGTAVYGKSQNGLAARFEILNPLNSYPALLLNNHGFGTTLSVFSHQTGTTGPAINILSLGLGGGITSETAKGKSGVFATLEPSALQENLLVTTVADVSNAIFNSNHETSTASNLVVNQLGNGRGVEINLTKNTNTKAGLYVETAGNKGVEVVSDGLYGVTAAAFSDGAVAIAGNTGQTANDAIGVRGRTGANVENGIGVLGESGASDPTGIGVKGVSYAYGEDRGAVTGINMADGAGVYGEAKEVDGIGILGVVGNTSEHNVAAVFKNLYNNNTRAVTKILTNGKGSGLFMENTNLSNVSAMLHVRNLGTGQFLRFEGNLGDVKTTISKSGDIVTDGTIKVREDKGIVRSSTSAQQRIEHMTVEIPEFTYGACCPEFVIIDHIEVEFDNPFSAPPIVLKGDLVSGYVGDLRIQVDEVTETGFTIEVQNLSTINWSVGPNTQMKFVAIGNE